MNLAFAGFRHGHIMTLYEMAQKHPEINILGGFEPHEESRKAVEASHNVEFPYASYEEMLNDPKVDVVTIGSYYSARGGMVIKALKAGKHVLCDKPICTDLKELDEIEALCKETGLVVMCMLDLRYACYTAKAKELIANGAIGDVRIISFTGQHPLTYGTRPSWYFEEGCHGGTINDIAIHGVDLVRYFTGKNLSKIDYAKTWNSYAYNHPHFKDCAQFAAEFDGIQVMADVSYAAPSWEAQVPTYWEFTVWGSTGMMRFNLKNKAIDIYTNGMETIPVEAVEAPIMEALIAEIGGEKTTLTTFDVLKSQRQVLELQQAADKNA